MSWENRGGVWMGKGSAPFECSKTERIIAEFLEDFARKIDEETRKYPSLSMLPKGPDTWQGFLDAAEKLAKMLGLD